MFTLIDGIAWGIVAGLCCVSVFLLGRRARSNWSVYTEKMRDYWWSLFGWTFVGLEGSIENLVLHNNAGPRTFIAIIVSIFTLRGLLRLGPLVQEKDRERYDKARSAR